MLKNRLLSFLLVFCVLWLAFSGTGAARQAIAQTPPPTINSEGEGESQVTPLQPPTAVLEAGPATEDAIPIEEVDGSLQVPTMPNSGLDANSDSWIGSLPHGIQAGQQTSSNTNSMVLWDNGPLVTHPGGGYNGNDASVLQSSLGLNTYGFGVQTSAGNRMADDFEVSGANSWQVQTVSFYTYQTGAYAYPPVSTITALYLQIWDGPPNDPASSIIFGDLVTNRLVDTYWSSIYRVIDTSMTNSERPVMVAVASVNISLPIGTYWLEWTINGTGSSGPWAPPISIIGQTTTGNALQYTTSSGAWAAALDTGTGTQQGVPFVMEGMMGDWLWEQPLSSVNQNAYVNQEFSDYPTYSSYLSDDFVAAKSWMINTIFVPGSGWNGFSTLMNATALNWKIYADNGGVPAGDPSGVGAPPIWSLSALPTDARVTITTGSDGYQSNTLLVLNSPIKLPPGHYWLLFYPTLNFGSYGQFGVQPSDTLYGLVAKFVNPGGGFGYGTAWQDWIVVGAVEHDIAFSIGGTEGELWKSVAPIDGVGRSRPAAAAVNGEIYLIGGEISGGRANTVDEYDPAANTWTVQAGLMPVPASNICAAAIGTDIYIPGGYDTGGAYLSTLQVYHTTSDTWSTITTDPLPMGLAGPGCAALNGKLYVFGGNNLSGYQSAAYVYDPTAAAGSRWSALASMPHARAYLGGVAVNGKIYAVGGRDATTSDFNYVEAYTPADNTWHTVTSLSKGRGGLGVYAVGNSLYACGGGWNSYYDDCEVYDTTQGYGGPWTAHPAVMIQGRRTYAYANLGPVLYAIAGYNGSYMTTAERWSYESFLPMIMNKPFTHLGFDSQFNGSAYGWYSHSGDWYIGSEYLYSAGLDNLWSTASYYLPFANLDYTARIIRLGCAGCANNLLIRGTPDPLNAIFRWDDYYSFQYARNGFFSVWKSIDGVETAIQSWAYTDAIHQGDVWNTLRVFANGTSIYFTINGVLVWSGTDTSLSIGRAGIGMYGSNAAGDEIRVDWATLYTDVDGMMMSETVSPEQQQLNDAANLNPIGDETGLNP